MRDPRDAEPPIKGMPDLEESMSATEKNQNAWTFAMQGRQMYAGSVPEAAVQLRRRKNKASRKARRNNRAR